MSMNILYRILPLLALAIVMVVEARAQDDCATVIDRATDLYENAGFEEAIAILRPCLAAGLSDEERWQGYRLLALSHLFLNDPLSADTAIRMLLEINPRYQPNPGRDPIELIRPLQSYGSFPRFYAGPKGGVGTAVREITGRRTVSGNRDLVRTPELVVGTEVGLMFDLNVSSTLSVATEMLYSRRGYAYTAEPQLTLRTSYSERLAWLTIPLMIRYQFGESGPRPFVYAGYFVQSLLGATSDLTATRIDPGADTMAARGELHREFAMIDRRTAEERRTSLNHGPLAGAGLFVPIGAGLLVADLRFEQGLATAVRDDARFDDAEILYGFFHIDDDFRWRNISLQIGYVYQFGFTVYRK